MNLKKFTDDMQIISKLSDNPTETAAELKAKFDEGGIKVRNFINEMIDNLHNAIWPVGSVYISVNDNNPEELFGGVWEKIENAFLLGASSTHSLGSSGGEEEHTLSIKEMPEHAHDANVSGASFYMTRGYGSSSLSGLQAGPAFDEGGISGGVQRVAGMRTSGAGVPHNNMPPYLAVGIWKRIK